MNDPEKSLKILSVIVSGLLVVLAVLFLVFGQGEPVEAEAVMEYSAPAGFDPSELTDALHTLRKDQAFLREVAIRSGFAKASEPELDRLATGLTSRMTFEPNWKESGIAIRFTHRKAATAANVANAIAAVAKENLELQRQKLAEEIIRQENAVEDKRKLLEQIIRTESIVNSQNETESEILESERRFPRGGAVFIDAGGDYESALRRLEELKAKPVASIGALRAATLPND